MTSNRVPRTHTVKLNVKARVVENVTLMSFSTLVEFVTITSPGTSNAIESVSALL